MFCHLAIMADPFAETFVFIAAVSSHFSHTDQAEPFSHSLHAKKLKIHSCILSSVNLSLSWWIAIMWLHPDFIFHLIIYCFVLSAEFPPKGPSFFPRAFLKNLTFFIDHAVVGHWCFSAECESQWPRDFGHSLLKALPANLHSVNSLFMPFMDNYDSSPHMVPNGQIRWSPLSLLI